MMKFFRKKITSNNEPVKYEAWTYPDTNGKKAALQGERWVCEDEFINTTSGPAWEKLLARINAAKAGKQTDLEFKCVDGKYFFKSITVFAIDPIPDAETGGTEVH